MTIITFTHNIEKNKLIIHFEGHSKNTAVCAWVSCLSELLKRTFKDVKEDSRKDLFNYRAIELYSYSLISNQEDFLLMQVKDLLEELSKQYSKDLEIKYFNV